MERRGTRIDCESLVNVSREKQIKGWIERSSDPEASSTSRLGSVSHCSQPSPTFTPLFLLSCSGSCEEACERHIITSHTRIPLFVERDVQRKVSLLPANSRPCLFLLPLIPQLLFLFTCNPPPPACTTSRQG